MKLPDVEKILERPRAEALFLALACISTAVYRGFGFASVLMSGVPSISHISYDGVFYAQIARNILAGDGLGWEAMLFPVLQPIIVAAVSYVNNIDNLAFIASYVSQTAGGAVLIPVYYLAREYFGRKAAAATVIILIPYPHLAAMSGGDTAEALYTFFIFLSLLVAYKSLSGVGLKRLYLFLAGLCLGLCYLARPEGLFIFAVYLALAAWRLFRQGGAKDAARGAALVLAGFIIFAAPYAVYLTKSYGRFILSPKLPYESVVMKQKVFGEQLMMHEVEGLTPSGNIVWREKGGAGLVLEYIKDDPVRFASVYLKNLASELPWNVRNSSHLAGYPIVYPVYLWALALVGFGLLFWAVDTRWKAVLLWAPFFNLFIYPVFTAGFWIYHAPYVPALVILAVGGLMFISGRAARLAGRPVPILLIAVLLWVGYSAYIRFSSEPEKVDVISFKSIISDQSRVAGMWGRENLGTDKTYMLSWSRLVYYLGGRWVSLPMARPSEVVDYGVRNGADFLVEELLGEETFKAPRYAGTPGLKLVNVYQARNAPYKVVFWKIMKPPAAGRGMPAHPGEG